MISVIVPIYNMEKYLARCLDSIVNQTYKDLEIILVDDGSTDNSRKICDEYAKKDKRIKVIHKSNQGVSAARNDGIDIAGGEYYAFVDSDDYVSSKMFERLYSNAVRYNADISVCDFVSTSGSEYSGTLSDCVVDMNSDLALKHLYIDADLGFVILCGKLFRKELFDGIRLPVGIKCAEDNYITYKLLYKAKNVVFEKSKLYMYFQRSDSETKTFDSSSAEDFKAFAEQMKFWKSENRMDLHRMCFVRCFKRLCLTLDCATNYEKSPDFYSSMKSEYEKAIDENIKDAKIGWLEKQCYLTDWFTGKQNRLPFYYIRVKDLLRNLHFKKVYGLT